MQQPTKLTSLIIIMSVKNVFVTENCVNEFESGKAVKKVRNTRVIINYYNVSIFVHLLR